MPVHKLKSKLDKLSYSQQQKLKAYAKKRLEQIKSRDEGELAAALKIGKTPVFKAVINAALGQIEEGSEAMKRAITSSISAFYIEQEKKISDLVKQETSLKARLKKEQRIAENDESEKNRRQAQVEIDKIKTQLGTTIELLKEVYAETRKGTLDQEEIATEKEEDLIQQLIRRSHKLSNTLINDLLSGVPIKIIYQKNEIPIYIAKISAMAKRIDSHIDNMHATSQHLTSWMNKLGAEADALKGNTVALLEASIAHLNAQSQYFHESLLTPFSETLQAFIDFNDLKHKKGWLFKREKIVDEGLVPWEMINTIFKLKDTAIQYKASLENIEALNMALPKYLGAKGASLKRSNEFLQKCITESKLKDEGALRERLDDCRQEKAMGRYLSWRKVAAEPFDVSDEAFLSDADKGHEDIQLLLDSLNRAGDGGRTAEAAAAATAVTAAAAAAAKAEAKEARKARKRDKRKGKAQSIPYGQSDYETARLADVELVEELDLDL